MRLSRQPDHDHKALPHAVVLAHDLDIHRVDPGGLPDVLDDASDADNFVPHYYRCNRKEQTAGSAANSALLMKSDSYVDVVPAKHCPTAVPCQCHAIVKLHQTYGCELVLNVRIRRSSLNTRIRRRADAATPGHFRDEC